jgi:hypothetical protein
MPAQVVAAAVPMDPDAPAEFLHFGKEIVARHPLEVVIGHIP